MINRSFDVISDDHIIAKEVNEDDLLMLINAIMDNGSTSVTLIDHVFKDNN